MPRDPKREAQMVEEAGLTAEPVERASVANPDAIAEKGIEAAQAKAPQPKQTPIENARVAKQDRLDRERAAGEGMSPPPSSP